MELQARAQWGRGETATTSTLVSGIIPFNRGKMIQQ
jgi:hypothetical protein